MAGQPSLIVGTTTNYVSICDQWFDSWQPTPTAAGFYAISSIALKSGSGPPVTPAWTLSAENDDPDDPLLKDPLTWEPIWIDPAPLSVSALPPLRQAIWAPIAPDNYVPLGVVVTAISFKSGEPPPPPKGNLVKCLRADHAIGGTFDEEIYNGDGYDNPTHICVMRIAQSAAMFAQAGKCPPNVAVFIPKGLPKVSSGP